MSVGWQRQYEVEAICDFCQIVGIFAAEKPNDAKLQAFYRKCRLTTLMLITQEEKDIERRSVCADRAADCRDCRAWNNGERPCDGSQGRRCKYALPAEQLKAIKRYFGDEGIHFIRWSSKIISKREAKACSS